jgi:hypothetical protein
MMIEQISNTQAERGKVLALHPEGPPEPNWEDYVLPLSDVSQFLAAVRQEQDYPLEPHAEVVYLDNHRSLEHKLALNLRFAYHSMVRFVNSFR